VAFSRDGTQLASGGGLSDPEAGSCGAGEVKVWDLAAGKERTTLKGEGRRVAAVAFSPDGRTLAWGRDDGTVRLADVATGKERAVYREHAGAVLSLAFAPDGRTLASASQDQAVKLWDVPAP
jgi:WD40 repeat protein